MFDFFLPSLLITFANNMEPDEDQQNVFLSHDTGSIKFWSLHQGVRILNFEEKTKQNKNKTKKQEKSLAVFLTK